MKVSIVKKENDPMAMRISIGGNLQQAYFVYRGNLKEIQMLLKDVAEEIEKLQVEPPISDNMGKKYA